MVMERRTPTVLHILAMVSIIQDGSLIRYPYFLHILGQEHQIQQDVFNMMHEQGLYPTPAAQQEKVQELKQQYSQCVK